MKKGKHTQRTVLFFLILFLSSMAVTYFIAIKMYKKGMDVNNINNAQPQKSNNKNIPNPIPKEKSSTEKVEKTEITISSVGDCTLGHDDKFAYQNSLPHVLKKNNNDYSYFFRNVKDIFSKDDITTANLETTFTNATSKADKQFTFKADPEYAKALTAASIEGVNLSNNHIYDYGKQGFTDTVDSIKKENIGYFGEGNIWIKEINGIKFGFLGYKGYYYDNNFLKKLKNDIQNLKNQNCTVIINFHWGDESKYNPNSTQEYIGRFAIDNGADLIVGHHPHVIQGVEQYKGTFIFYSLGNFCFGGNINPQDKDTFILQSKFKYENKKLVSIGLRVVPCSISSVNHINDYKPTPAKDSEKTRILQKLNKLSPKAGFNISDDFTFFDVK